MAKKSAAAKKRARERKKANKSPTKSLNNESSSSSEVGTELAEAKVEDRGVRHVASALESLRVSKGEGASGGLQSTLSHPALLSLGGPPAAKIVDEPCFEIKPAAGKGLGVFAARDIPRGTRVISEKPLFSVPRDRIRTSDFQDLFQKLSAEDQGRYLQLAHTYDPNDPQVRSIFTNNCMSMGDSSAIFLSVSRIDHSCIPNSHSSFNGNIGELTIHAFKDITEGQEILISYGRPYGTAPQRKQQLLKTYKFDCACPACVPRNSSWEKSDERRGNMNKFANEISKWEQMQDIARSSIRKPEVMVAIEGLIELLKQEGLTHGPLSQAYADAAKWSKRLGRPVQARAWAERWRENDRVCVGLDSDVAEKSRDFLAELEEARNI